VRRIVLGQLALAVIAVATVVLPAASAHAFACLQINNRCVRWVQGGTTLRSFLGNEGPLINGTLSWDQNTVNAANDWNAAGAAFHFDVTVGGNFINPCGPRGGGHACRNTGPVGDNPVFFTDSFCGLDFGDIIELTNNCADSNSGAMLNAPVFVNAAPANASNDPLSKMGWNAYDGPIRIGADNRVVNDIRRVLVHELGHVLGLDHPDSNGQSVFSIMNSRESNIDRIQQDDINGLFSLYPSTGPPQDSSNSGNNSCHIAERDAPMNAWILVLPAVLALLRLWRRTAS
jgi:hypothetical protein